MLERFARATRSRSGSLRVKLTLGFVLILALALGAVGIFQYVAVRSFLYQEVSGRLALQAQLALGGRPLRPNFQFIAQRAASQTVGAALYDSSGNELARVEPLVNNPGWVRPRLRTGGYQVLGPGPDHVMARVLTTDPPGLYLVMETSLATTDATIRDEARFFMVAALTALLVAGLLGYLVTGRLLRRLEHVSTTASAIAAGDIGRRADIRGSDEVAALGAAFDEMVGRLQQEIVRQQESEDYMRRFVADASHELRTPLTALRGNLDLLRRGAIKGGVEYEGSLSDMHKTALRMSRLVEDLMTLTRLEGVGELTLVPTDAASALGEAARTARHAAGRHEIQIEEPSDLYVSADPDALQRVLLNLVENAAKYSPPGAPIQLRAVAGGPKGRVQIEVEDRGPGITPEEQGRIFERFYRGDKARKAGGTGLGLAICAALVKLQGGSISVRSEPGKGSVFSVDLAAAAPAG